MFIILGWGPVIYLGAQGNPPHAYLNALADMEFKQRQPEVEKSQVTMAIKLGEDAYGELWKASWTGHTVVVKKLKTKGDLFRAGFMDTFPQEYSKLRWVWSITYTPLGSIPLFLSLPL